MSAKSNGHLNVKNGICLHPGLVNFQIIDT